MPRRESAAQSELPPQQTVAAAQPAPCNGSRSSADCSVPACCSGQQQTAVSNLTIEDGVDSWKRKPPSRASGRCVIRGDRLEAVDVTAARTPP